MVSGKRALLTLDRWKVARLERRATELADVITSITDDDRRLFEADAPTKRHLVLRPGWSGQVTVKPPVVGQRPRRVGIVGSFEWHVKQENLRRFLSAADAVFASAGVELVVGGKVPESFVSEFDGRLEATRFLGWVDDLGAVLRECRIGVISEPLGGGFKMKSLDYVFNHVAIASLTGAAAGLPLVAGVDMLEAADERALADAIVAVIDDTTRLEAMATSAIELCSRTFSWDAAGDALVGSVASLDPRR
jgi:glycosyltransferase involved in cell wall biosynthesis